MRGTSEGTLVLSREDVEGLLDLETAIDVTRNALLEQARGNAGQRAPMHLDLPDGGALRTVSGAMLESQRAGVRTTGAFALASPSGAAMLFDTRTADLLCVLAYPHGTTRTAAMMGLAADILAAEDASRITLIGTGRNAMGLLQAALLKRPIEEIRIYGRNPDRRAQFVSAAQDLLGVPVRESSDLHEGLNGADIVFVSTDSVTPVISFDDVPAECLVAGMGAPAEFHEDLYLGASSVVVSSKVHERDFDDVWHGQMRSVLVDLDATGAFSWDRSTELADLVQSAEPPRRGVRVFRESAGGYGDIALAAYIYDRALATDRGHRVHFS